METAFLYPVVGVVALTMLIWLVMLVTRIRQFSQPEYQGINPDTRLQVQKTLKGAAELSSNNFNNLLELPVLFYVLAFLILHVGIVDSMYLQLAWLFFISRCLHSLIHCTYNNVMHRFLLWLISSLVLWVMLVRFLLGIL